MTGFVPPTRFTIAVLILASALFSVCAGHEWASPADTLRAISGGSDLQSRLITEWRIPRVFTAAFVGALLGLSGAIFQGVFRNPLAEPYLLGSSGGAAIGATIAFLVPLGMPSAIALAVLAFAGAWLASLAVVNIARLAGSVDSAGLLLSGVAVAYILLAVRSFLMLWLSDETVNLAVMLSWTLGGIQTPSWFATGVLAALTAVSIAMSLLLASKLDLLGLGEEQARAFGLDTRRFLNVALLVASVVVASAVAWGGLVLFVGLISPHIARWWGGPKHKTLLPISAAVGAIMILICDGLARSILPPAEVPLGLITAFFGGPFFLVILARRLRS